MSKLSNKIALVTGGNSGIGLATAKLFKDQGAKVIITARSKETFELAQKEYGNQFDVVQTDVSLPEDLDRLYTHIKYKYGKFDILFANAGVAKAAPTSEVTPEFFDNQFDTNVKGLYFTIAKAIPLLNKGSSVVLTASVVASKGFGGFSIYSATKASVRNFARSWTAEFPVTDVRFNVLSPGPIETPIFEKMGVPEEARDSFAGMTPIKRMGTADEMAKVALFLASDDSSYICGAEIMADGGLGQV
jgi:NAD(P)-dependent dehydrogenase (short-subunit alcohol dehydrogenase family)